MNSKYRLPEELQTDRYLLRRIVTDDAEAIFKSYGTDAIATRYLGWKPHHYVQQTRAFLVRVAQEWDDATGFPLVAFNREAPDELVGMFHPRNRTVPVLQDGEDPPLWETGAVLRYLANRYASETDFWPSDPLARANVDRWAEWSKINITLGFTAPIFWRVERTPIEQRDPQAVKAAVVAFEKTLLISEECLAKRPFLAGDQLTLADIQLGHVLYRYYDIEIDRRDFPNMKAYYYRLITRSAFREHVMVSYDELRA